MTPYLETEVYIACDLCVHNKKDQQMNFFTYKIKYHLYNQLFIKKYIYTTLNLYIHPAKNA